MNEPLVTVKCFVEPSFAENCFVVSAKDEAGRRAGWIIDPSFEPHLQRALGYLTANQIDLEKIILTHGHADHIAGVDAVRAAHPAAKLLIAREDEPMLADADLNLSAPFGLAIVMNTPADADLPAGGRLQLGSTEWTVLDTSGHSPGGRSLYCAQAGLAFTGDALFAGSIGRTNFPGSDPDRLIANIKNHLLTLPGPTLVYSGHGPATTIEKEQKSNPWLAE